MPINNGPDPVLTLPQNNAVGWGATIETAFNTLNAAKANVGHTHTGFATEDHLHPELVNHNHDNQYATLQDLSEHHHSEIDGIVSRLELAEVTLHDLKELDEREGSLSRYVTKLQASNHTHPEFALLSNGLEIMNRLAVLEAIIKPTLDSAALTITVSSDVANKIALSIILTPNVDVKIGSYRIEIQDYQQKLFYKCESKTNVIKIPLYEIESSRSLGNVSNSNITIYAYAQTISGDEIIATPYAYTLPF